MNLKIKVKELMEKNPSLNYGGLILEPIRDETKSSKERRLLEMRAKMNTKESLQEIRTVLKWLKTSKTCFKSKKLNKYHTTFGLKTYVQSDTGVFISHGAFILALMILDLEVVQVKNSFNAYTNVGIRK